MVIITPSTEAPAFNIEDVMLPAGYAFQANAAASVVFSTPIAAASNFWSRRFREGNKISAEEANRKYGVQGKLSFDTDMYEQEAAFKNKLIQDQDKRETIAQIASGQSFINAAAGFTGRLATQGALDPVNYLPFPDKFTKLGILGPRIQSALNNRIVNHAVGAAVGTALTEPILMSSLDNFGIEYGLEDAAYDVIGATAFGATVGSGVQLYRNLKASGIKKSRAFESKSMSQAIDEKLSPEGQDIVTNYAENFNSTMRLEDPNIKAIVKMDMELKDPKAGSKDFFTSDSILRRDLDELTADINIRDTLEYRATRPMFSQLVPENLAGRNISEIVSEDGTIGFRQFASYLYENNLVKSTGANKLNNLLGTNYKNSSSITLKEAEEIANRLAVEKMVIDTTDPSGSDIFQYKLLQADLKALPTTSNKTLDTYTKEFKALLKRIDKEYVKENMSVSDLAGMSSKEKKDYVLFTKHVMEADMPQELIDDILAGDESVVDMMYYRSKALSQLDTMTKEDALKTMQDLYVSRPQTIQRQADEVLTSIKETVNKTLNKQTLDIEESILDENINLLKQTLAKEELAAIDEAFTKIDEEINTINTAEKTVLECLLGAG